MISTTRRVTVTVSKKTPIPHCQYSSRSYSITEELELTVGPGESPEQVERQLGELEEKVRERLEARVDEWLAQGEPEPGEGSPTPGPLPHSGSTTKGMATEKQLRFISTLANSPQGQQKLRELLEKCGVGNPQELTKAAASRVIDELKAERAQKSTRAMPSRTETAEEVIEDVKAKQQAETRTGQL